MPDFCNSICHDPTSTGHDFRIGLDRNEPANRRASSLLQARTKSKFADFIV
jgi:hypothetical protein